MPNHSIHAHSIDTAEFRRLRREVTRLNDRFQAFARKFQSPAKRSPRKVPTSSTTPHNFHQRVQVVSRSPSLKSIHGKLGTILGRAPAQGHWTYTVWIDDEGVSWSLAHHQLKPANQPPGSPPAHVKHLRVKVDSRGRGSVAH
jgi:hypothetical protein